MNYDDKINFKKIYEEDADFRAFISEVKRLVFERGEAFDEVVRYMYAMYQTGITVDQAAQIITNQQRFKDA